MSEDENDRKYLVITLDQVVETPEQNKVPVRIQITYPKGLGMSALVALHDASHTYIKGLYDALIKAGDTSAEYLESKILLSQLEEEGQSQTDG